MVSCDNTAFLLTQLRTAFVGGDDTGVCELLIDRIRVCDEDVAALLQPPGASQSQMSLLMMDQSASDSAFMSAADSQASLAGETHSPDIMPPKLDGQPTRKKSTTQLRVSAAREERQKEKKRAAVSVEWSDDVGSLADSDVDYLFPAPAETPDADADDVAGGDAAAATPVVKTVKRQSLLAKRLAENAESAVQNAFTEYSQFEVSTNRQGLRRIRVFFYELDRAYAVDVTPNRDTSVEQFIGLACYKYIFSGHSPGLPAHLGVDDLDLFMYEETDDLDADFPPLERRDRIYKYDFSTLAVVQRHRLAPQQQQPHQRSASFPAPLPPSTTAASYRPPSMTTGSHHQQQQQLLVHVTLPQGFTTMQLDRSLPVSALLEKIVRRRKLKEHRGHKYVLRRADDVSVHVPLDVPLGEAGTAEFVLVRENSGAPATTQGGAAAVQSAADAALMPFGGPGDSAATATAAAAASVGPAASAASDATAAAAAAAAAGAKDAVVGDGGGGDLLDSLALRQYRLQLRGVINRDVMLSVSGDCLVLDFLGSKTKLFSRRSSATYGWELIGGCQLEERPGSSKATVHLHYKSANSPATFSGSISSMFHCLLLEGGDGRALRGLSQQVNNILLLRGGSARKIFLQLSSK